MYIVLEVLRHQFIVDNSTPTICCSFIHECASSVWCWKGVIYDLLLCLHFIYSIKNPLNFDSFVIIVNRSASVPAQCWIFNEFASNWNFFYLQKISNMSLKNHFVHRLVTWSTIPNVTSVIILPFIKKIYQTANLIECNAVRWKSKEMKYVVFFEHVMPRRYRDLQLLHQVLFYYRLIVLSSLKSNNSLL